MSEIVDKIKEKLGAVDLISEYLKLEKAGSNYKALCPFHNEKTPSFMVNPERNFWYCFGCQKGGDIFSFLMEIEGIDFKEALKRLAEKTGVEIPRWNKKLSFEKSKKELIFEINQEAKDYFFQNLKENNSFSQLARRYLLSRGLNQELIEQFQIGLAKKSWDALLRYLIGKGYQIRDIFEAGLIVQKNSSNFSNISNFYDRFRERIIFPIFDEIGKVVGFSGRVLPYRNQEKEAKYINTPQTLIYDKSRILFGLYQAKTEIKKEGSLILVEGNLDVILSFKEGIKNIVAVSGTALTEKHLNLIRRYTNEINLCFDMDKAGQNATEVNIKNCLKEGFEVAVIELPLSVKDVGELVEKQKGLWAKVAKEQKKNVMKYFFEKNFKIYDFREPSGKKNIIKNLLNILKEVADPVERNFWLIKLAEKLEIKEDLLTEILEKYKIKKEKSIFYGYRTKKEKNNLSKKEISREILLEEYLLGIFVLFKKELTTKVSSLLKLLDQLVLKNIWLKIINEEKFSREEQEEIEKIVARTRFSFDEKGEWQENEIDFIREWEKTIGELMEILKKKRILKLRNEIAYLEKQGKEELAEELIKELNDLMNDKTF